MAPKEITFTRGTVLQAALDVVREQGWNALTARGVADRLGSSVAPVYSAFGSMENLQRETLEAVGQLLREYTRRTYFNIPFLNIGAGIVSFAREEPLLFQAYFQIRHPFQDVVEEFNASVLAWMKNDAQTGLLSETSRSRLYDNIGYYTMGLAAAVAAGRVVDASEATVVRLLKNMGNVTMFAEISGIADFESPDNEREWARLLRKKNIRLPKAAAGINPGTDRPPAHRPEEIASQRKKGRIWSK
jgi:AcrR family transcriptional regulator